MHEAASRALFEDEVGNFSERLAKSRGWVFHKLEYPIIDSDILCHNGNNLRVQLVCDNWNELPPSIILLNADGSHMISFQVGATGVFNPSKHPATGRPFVCMRGSREYHTHPSHINDPWEPLRHLSAYSLGGILHQLSRAWRKGR